MSSDRHLSNEYDYLIKLLLVGDAQVGKGVFLLRFSDDTFAPSFITTIGIDFKVRTISLSGKQIKLQIWDTAGQERFRTVTAAYFRGAMGILLIFSIFDEASFGHIEHWSQLIESLANPHTQRILVGHCYDASDDPARRLCHFDSPHRVISHERAAAVATTMGIKYIECCSRANINVEEPFLLISQQVLDSIGQDSRSATPSLAQAVEQRNLNLVYELLTQGSIKHKSLRKLAEHVFELSEHDCPDGKTRDSLYLLFSDSFRSRMRWWLFNASTTKKLRLLRLLTQCKQAHSTGVLDLSALSLSHFDEWANDSQILDAIAAVAPQVTEIDLSMNNLPVLPAALSPAAFPRLRILRLAYNALDRVPELRGDLLQQLTLIDLQHNRLDTIPLIFLTEVLQGATRLSLLIDHNPLASFPPAARTSIAAMQEFMRATQDQVLISPPFIKLQVIGDENVGKTTLVASLRGVRHDGIATDGIDITELVSDNAPPFRVWDFGGQAVYLPSHSLFFSKRSVFVLLVNLVNPNIPRLLYWARLIRAKNTLKLPVLLLGTFADQCSSEMSPHERLHWILSVVYPQVALRFTATFSISLLDASSVQQFSKHLYQLCQSHTQLCQPIASNLASLSAALLRIRSKNHLTFKEFSQLAASYGFTGHGLNRALDYLVDVGDILFWRYACIFCQPAKNLEVAAAQEPMVIINPDWLARTIASVITFRHNFTRRGFLLREHLAHIMHHDSPAVLQQILDILQYFEIIFPCDADHQRYLVPFNLPEISAGDFPRFSNDFHSNMIANEATVVEPSSSRMSPSSSGELPSPLQAEIHADLPISSRYLRIFRSTWIPEGFLPRLFAYLSCVLQSTLSFKHQVWKNALILSSSDQRFQFMFFFNAITNELVFELREYQISSPNSFHDNPAELLQSILYPVELLIESLGESFGNSIDRFFACPTCLQSPNIPNPTFFSLEFLIESLIQNEGHLICPHPDPHALHLLDIAPDLKFLGVPQKLNIAPECLVREDVLLGTGGFGEVYQGKLITKELSNVPVAIKVLKQSHEAALATNFLAFCREAYLMGRLGAHPNLVHFYGICSSPGIQLVMELISGGTLYDLLIPRGDDGERHPISESDLPYQHRLNIATDVLKGLIYLHEATPPMIHRDLHCGNIFIVRDPNDPTVPIRSKIGDFGLSQMAAPHASGVLGSWQWLAPEVFATDSRGYTVTSDVYSFGLILWDLVALDIAYRTIHLDRPEFAKFVGDDAQGQPVYQPRVQEIKEVIQSGHLRPTIPSTCPDPWKPIIESCWSSDPSNRPNLFDILKIFGQLLCEIEMN